ncbi:MAG: polysaccharide biosynthesis protein [Nitrososphaerales archaeon]|jgi:UDP-glucose 4-epimerase
MNSLAQSTLLITGGTGTFGNAVVEMASKIGFAEIRIFSRDEKKQNDMRERLKNSAVKFYIGDVRDYDSVHQAMRGVDFVFHAAALKQVPSCEFFPIEAVQTNTLGAENVMRAALAFEVSKVVVLSTDKAVYPVNAMGMSKGLMEKCMVAKARMFQDSSTVFCGTRYGNVMASRGSVIPLFLNQILAGEPLTVTDPNMTRFMMTIEGAVNLVLYAFNHSVPGDIFVQKAPSATIDTLAKALLKLLNAQNEIRIIGTRHGEKLYETLLNREEMAQAEDIGDYYRVPADLRNLNYSSFFSSGKAEVSEAVDYNSHNAKLLDVDGMIDLLLKLECVRDAINGKAVVV